jgi:hypothetical protein
MTGSRWACALRWICAAGTAALLSACGGGGGGGGSSDGILRVALTDAPTCGYEHVFVTVEKVRVHQSGSAGESDAGWSEVLVTPPKQIDLRTLQNGVLQELGTTALPQGQYSQIRLVLASNTATGTTSVANSVQPDGGTLTALATPSAQQSGLKIQAHFDVAAGQTTDLLLDFDACKSVVKSGNQFILKPVVNLVPRAGAGLQGYVATSLSLGSTTVAAQQNGVTVRSTAPDNTGKFSIPFLPAGTYTLVITSEGHATGVITGVPAGTATAVLNGTATAIATPVSSMADVTGTVSVTSVSGSSTISAVVTDATVRALQTLTGGPTIEVDSQNVESALGTYRVRLPVGPPVKGPYVSSAVAPIFTADPAVAGKYTIQVQSPGRTNLEKPADISGGTSINVNFNYGP